jgi:hypothetical protein
MTTSSYAAHGLAEGAPTAKSYQKHPRGWVRAKKPRDYSKMKASLVGAKYQDPTAVTLSATTISHLAAVNAVLGNLGTTLTGAGGAPSGYTYAMVANPSGYFKVVAAAVQVAAALPVSGTIAISISSTTAPAGETVTTPFTVTLT